ncbi:hypothetical protein Q3A80_19580 [Burkholderia sp. SR8]|uniref:hypothetical protein n=1 Tax=Burkholderia sp. SR8 TaxID=3062277 RepID=UPI004064174B
MQQMLPETGRQTEVGHFCFCFSFSWIYSLRWRLRFVDFGFAPIGYRASSDRRMMFSVVVRYCVGSDVG